MKCNYHFIDTLKRKQIYNQLLYAFLKGAAFISFVISQPDSKNWDKELGRYLH